MSNLKIIIITYDWPPRNSIAVHRPYAWAKYWSRAGCDVTVLTAKKYVYDEPLDLEMPSLEGVNILEVPYRTALKKSVVEDNKALKYVFETLKKYSGFIRNLIGRDFDIRDAWVKKAINVAVDLSKTKGVDVIVSTYGPRACHFIGHALKKNNPSSFWVADYRDMWSIRHDSGLKGKRKKQEQELEKYIVKDADLLTTVSAPLVLELSEFHNKEALLVSNGYDLDLSTVEARLKSPSNSGGCKERPLIISYTGMIYPGSRDPSPLFEAINQLEEDGKLRFSQISVNFYGKRLPGLQDLVTRFNADKYVTIHGHVTLNEALEIQKKSDVLLLLESGDTNAKGVLTGKVFEYMVSGKPVLSIGSKSDSAIGQLIKETGIGTVCENKSENVKNYIMDNINGNINKHFSPEFNEIKAYNRSMQSQKLLQVIKDQVTQ